jgi:hypothetical protein
MNEKTHAIRDRTDNRFNHSGVNINIQKYVADPTPIAMAQDR